MSKATAAVRVTNLGNFFFSVAGLQSQAHGSLALTSIYNSFERMTKQEQNGQAAPVYVYEFSHPTEVPGFPECSGTSCHTAELPYVFNNVSRVG